MGKAKTTIPFGSFWLRPQTNQKGETPVYVRYYVQGRYLKKSTNIFINPADWDATKQAVKGRSQQAIKINGRLRSIKQTYDDLIMAYKGELTYKVVEQLLSDEWTGSSGEAVLLCFRGLESTRTFGAPTAGYASCNQPFKLSDGSQLVLTTGTDVARTGEEFCDDPIQPEVLTETPLEEALEWIDKMKSGFVTIDENVKVSSHCK